jgi:WD40 repeat protein/predicted Ser/Thr protein kinase
MAEPSLQRVEELFDRAVDLDPPQQAAFLDEQCQGEADLRAAVEEFLQLHSKAQADESLLRSPLAATRPQALAPPAPRFPTIARYRVVRLLGEGGMGTVYEAEQDSPRRTVALKVLRSGPASDFLLKRFAREAQILGRLHHGGIAQVYDAGVAEGGQPYFVMELIAGVPLDQYAREHALDAGGRLELVARVCDAVQHAHERGVIHRDLKPGNILVEPSGQPKVLDFGVARAADLGLTAGGRTEAGQLLGTLGYMSPEQASGDPAAIDPRGDVYALGVILYELLADRLPYSLDGLALPEAVRVIREQEPSRLGSLDGRLRGDVETIVAKALEKDRARRYASAGELAADLRRFLSHEPIRARPASALYQLRKFARRHKALVGAGLGIGLALAAGTVISVLYAVRADHNARVAAENERQATENARQATENERKGRYQTYRAHLAAATAALSNHDVVDAARQLDEAPKDLRGWEWRHLFSRLDDSAAAIPLPRSEESSYLLPAEDRLRVATVTEEGVRLTDLDGGEAATLPIRVREGKLNTVALTRQGIRVGVWIGDRTFVLLDKSGKVLCQGQVEKSQDFQQLFVSPDGKRLAAYWYDGELLRLAVFDATSGRQTAVCEGPHALLWAVTFSPDGARLATAGDDGKARVWDVDPEASLPVLRGHTSYVYPVAFSPDGRWIASGAWDRTVRLWDAATGEWWATLPHPGYAWSLAYGPDGSWLVSANEKDDLLRVWDTATARLRRTIPVADGNVRHLTVSPDGKRVAGTVLDRLRGKYRLYVCDFESGERLHSDDGGALAYSPDGRWLAARAADEKTVLLLDARTHAVAAQLAGDEKNVHSAAFSPDSRRLATCGADRTVRVWEVGTRACRKLPGHTDEVFAAAFHPDGKRLATAGRDRAVWLWDLERGDEVARLPGHATYVWSLAFSSDGKTLVSGSGDFTLRLWDTEPLRERYQARREAAALRPEAERLVGKLWRPGVDPGKVVETLRSDRELGEPLRQAALRDVMRRARPPEGAPGSPDDPP